MKKKHKQENEEFKEKLSVEEIERETAETESAETEISANDMAETTNKEVSEDYQQQCIELNDKNLRLMAEFDNYRKRTQKKGRPDKTCRRTGFCRYFAVS